LATCQGATCQGEVRCTFRKRLRPKSVIHGAARRVESLDYIARGKPAIVIEKIKEFQALLILSIELIFYEESDGHILQYDGRLRPVFVII